VEKKINRNCGQGCSNFWNNDSNLVINTLIGLGIDVIDLGFIYRLQLRLQCQ
jgi:hypothetical protein